MIKETQIETWALMVASEPGQKEHDFHNFYYSIFIITAHWKQHICLIMIYPFNGIVPSVKNDLPSVKYGFISLNNRNITTIAFYF